MKYLVVLFLAVTNVWAQPQPRAGQHDRLHGTACVPSQTGTMDCD